MKKVINILIFFLIVTAFLFQPVPTFLDYRLDDLLYFPFSEIIFIMIFILWIFSIDKQKFKKLYEDKLSFSFLLFFGLFVVGYFYSEDKYNSIITIKSIMYLLLVPILITSYEKKYLKYFLNFFLFVSIVSAFMTIILYLTTSNLNMEIQLSYISPFINHMYYGTILTLALSYFLISFKLEQKKSILFVNIISIITLLSAVALICNRSSLIGMYVALSFYFWVTKKDWNILKRVYLILGILFSITMYISIINPNCGFKFLEAKNSIINELDNDRKGTSLGCRFTYIESSIDLIKENPIIGVGTGDILLSMKKLYGEEGYKKLVTQPCLLGNHNQIFYFDNHNMYLTILMLFGPIGLLIFLYLFYTIYKVAKKINSWELIVCVIIVMLASIPITLFYTSSNFVLFFSLFVAIIYLNKKEKIFNETN